MRALASKTRTAQFQGQPPSADESGRWGPAQDTRVALPCRGQPYPLVSGRVNVRFPQHQPWLELKLPRKTCRSFQGSVGVDSGMRGSRLDCVSGNSRPRVDRPEGALTTHSGSPHRPPLVANPSACADPVARIQSRVISSITIMKSGE